MAMLSFVPCQCCQTPVCTLVLIFMIAELSISGYKSSRLHIYKPNNSQGRTKVHSWDSVRTATEERNYFFPLLNGDETHTIDHSHCLRCHKGRWRQSQLITLSFIPAAKHPFRPFSGEEVGKILLYLDDRQILAWFWNSFHLKNMLSEVKRFTI